MPDREPLRKMLGEPGVLEMIPISRSTLKRWCAIGIFPLPAPMGPGRVGWFLDEIRLKSRKRAIIQRVTARDDAKCCSLHLDP
jgi:predicted DNA-binding transcriptional regulator AlpA